MKLGFTGTRAGMTDAQRTAFSELVIALRPAEFHHGAAVGADAEAVGIVRGLLGDGVRVVAHPGVSAKGGENADRSETAVAMSDEVRPAATHFARNRNIVSECDMLAAVVVAMHRLPSGGTWYTVGHAEKVGKSVSVCWPDGTRSAP